MPTPHWVRRSDGNHELALVYNETYSIAKAWAVLTMRHRGSSHLRVTAPKPEARGTRTELSDARAYRLTVDRICIEVDEEIGVAGVTKAAFSWLLQDTPYSQLQRRLHYHTTKRSDMGDLLDDAIIRFWVIVTNRSITPEHKTESVAA